ncbi:MAG TPA: IS630 family transposase, partial [Rhizomicrobium sp.]|nr:IS630 family transposase [Rhizomicrobium sp.]
MQLERVRAAQPPGGRVEVWFQDEARIGQKNSLTRMWGQTGSRPTTPKDLGFASAYVFGAVSSSEGKAAALIMPICNTVAMNHHLCEISSQVAADAHAVVILDGASWHNSHGLMVPSNITLLALPPYSPELNPVERVWHYLRSHWLANSAFRSMADI